MSAAQRVVVTGASQGLGLEIARAFAKSGANLAICARNRSSIDAAAAAITGDFPDVQVVAHTADVSREKDVDEFIASALAELGGIDVLVVNAGIYGPKGGIADVDWSSWVEALHINLIGAVYTARSGLSALRKSRRGKILIISGGGATKPLPFVSAYAASKAGLVRFGETLAEELRGEGIDVNMIAPGALNTRLLDEILEAGADAVGSEFYEAALRQQASGGTPLTRGADLCVFLASAAADGISGKLISAPWDPWERFADARSRLDGDVYTLRRIVPEDRGWSW